MPSDTFYRLPAEKRARLTEAIIAELSRVPLSKMSINRIVQDAGIPRGSYYQYFNGSSDILTCVLGEFRECSRNLAEQIWRETNGALYAFFNGIFEYTLSYGLEEKRKDLFCNLFSEVSLGEMFTVFSERMTSEECVGLKEKLSGMEPRKKMIFEVMLAVFKEALVLVFTHAEQAEEIAENFRGKIRMLSEKELRDLTCLEV